MSIREIADGFRARSWSPVDVVRAALERIEATEPALHAWVLVDPEQALAAAEQAERELGSGSDRGPLHGIPIGIKDIFDVARLADEVWLCRSRRRVPRGNERSVGPSADRRRCGDPGKDDHAGVRRRHHQPAGPQSVESEPYSGRQLGRLSGRGGGRRLSWARWVRTRAAAFAFRRRPAASPVSSPPLVSSASTVSSRCRGPSTRSDRSRGPSTTPGSCGRSCGTNGLKGATETRRPRQCDRDTGSVFRGRSSSIPCTRMCTRPSTRAIDTLRERGATIVEAPWPEAAAARACAFVINRVETAAVHERTAVEDPERFARYGADLRLRVAAGRTVPATLYLKATRARACLQEHRGSPVFETQSTSCWRRRYRQRRSMPIDLVIEGTGLDESVGVAWTRLTMPFNATGQPVMALPCGLDHEGLPVGIQLAGMPGQEPALFETAALVEGALGFHRDHTLPFSRGRAR